MKQLLQPKKPISYEQFRRFLKNLQITQNEGQKYETTESAGFSRGTSRPKNKGKEKKRGAEREEVVINTNT